MKINTVKVKPMQTKEGVVFRVTDRTVGKNTFYSVKLDGVDGWVGMGTTRHDGIIEAGNTIKIGFVLNAKGYETLEKVKLISKGDPAPTAASRAAPAAGAKVDWVAKDRSIQYQSSRKDALQFLTLIVEQEIIKLPAKTKAKERLSALEGYLDLYTARFYMDIEAQGAVKRSNDELEVQESVPADEPKAAAKAAEKSGDDGWEEAGPDVGDGGDSCEW